MNEKWTSGALLLHSEYDFSVLLWVGNFPLSLFDHVWESRAAWTAVGRLFQPCAINRHAGNKHVHLPFISVPLLQHKENRISTTGPPKARVSAHQATSLYSLSTNEECDSLGLEYLLGVRSVECKQNRNKKSMRTTSCPYVVLHAHQWKYVSPASCQLHRPYTWSPSPLSSQPSVDMLSSQIMAGSVTETRCLLYEDMAMKSSLLASLEQHPTKTKNQCALACFKNNIFFSVSCLHMFYAFVLALRFHI